MCFYSTRSTINIIDKTIQHRWYHKVQSNIAGDKVVTIQVLTSLSLSSLLLSCFDFKYQTLAALYRFTTSETQFLHIILTIFHVALIFLLEIKIIHSSEIKICLFDIQSQSTIITNRERR